ncbi:MAG TPA: VanZ family protein [Gemmataceae bacterium]|nr:VanZ family protein [Gemmataceae bacterium]
MCCCRHWPAIHVVLFVTALITWSVALLIPVPHEAAHDVLGSDFGIFIFAKGLHVCAYTFLTILGGTAAWFGKKWIWILPALVAHGAITEFFQQFTGRTARIEDVGLDSLGIAIGGLLIWVFRRTRLSRTEEGSTSQQ